MADAQSDAALAALRANVANTTQKAASASAHTTAASANVSQMASAVQAQANSASWWSNTNAMTMSASVLVFGLLICTLAAAMIRWGNGAEPTLRVFGTLLIIVAALFLVVAGYDDKQIAPVMGLLGTIVGYLLGKSDQPTKKDDQTDSSATRNTQSS
ncbi:hypothetical protein [Azohydromonas aeria]|uniref:hypothetical protein n=1 Tax=Azohydromonas aeria TaxID=2590212 RepID=UPI0012FB4C57|nr:hypothetical protein [Azohydromonas aeria]